MAGEWRTATVAELQREGILLVEDGNHGEYRPRPDEFVRSGVAFIRAADMDRGEVLFDSAAKINGRARQRITKGIGAPGDVLLSHKGTVGKLALVPTDAPEFVCSLQTTFWRTRDTNLLDHKYLYSFLRSPGFRNQLATRAGETDMAPYVSLTSQRGLSVSLPTISEQRAIAHILGTLDDKIELNRRRNQTLEAMARALFQDWFVDFGPVRAKMAGQESYLPADLWQRFPDRLDDEGKPEGWGLVSASELIEFNPTEALRKGTPAPYLDMASLPTSGSWPEPPILREFGSGMRFRNGDTLLARITPCLENGKTAFVQCLPDNTVGWGSTEYIVMRPKAPVPAEYAYLLARDGAFREHAIKSMTGTSGRQRAQGDSVATFKLASPPDENVWHALARQVAPTFESIKSNAKASETLAALRDTLLPKLISGDLRITDAATFMERVEALAT